MRITYITILLITLLAACKKQIEPAPRDESSTAVDDVIPPCFGNEWEYVSSYPSRSVGLVFKNKLYVPDYADQVVRIFDGTNWTSIASSVPISTTAGNPQANLYSIVAFTIGSKGYIMKPHHPDPGFWEYNFAQNTWTRKADFPGMSRYDPAYFSVGDKGYIVGGWKSLDTYLSDTWQYNQATNTWSQKAGIGLPGRAYTAGFSINDKGYVLCGRVLISGNEGFSKGLLEYDPLTNDWSFKAAFPGLGRDNVAAFVMGDKVYAGGGGRHWFNPLYQDFYRFNPATNSWITIAEFPYAFQSFFGFSINSRGYCVMKGSGNNGNYVFRYIPQTCIDIGPTP